MRVTESPGVSCAQPMTEHIETIREYLPTVPNLIDRARTGALPLYHLRRLRGVACLRKGVSAAKGSQTVRG